MKKLSLLLVLAVISLDTLACLCSFSVDRQDINRLRRKSDLVFYASVEIDPEVNFPQITLDSTTRVENIILKVIKVWKGHPEKVMKLEAYKRGCLDASYRVGDRYLFFATLNGDRSGYETDNCRSIREFRRLDIDDPSKGDYDSERYYDSVRGEFDYTRKTLGRERKSRIPQ